MIEIDIIFISAIQLYLLQFCKKYHKKEKTNKVLNQANDYVTIIM